MTDDGTTPATGPPAGRHRPAVSRCTARPAHPVVVATGPDGEVLGSGRGYVDRLRPGGGGLFEAHLDDDLPPGTRYTAYPSP